MILFQLFCSFLQVGLFSVGGGYAAIPLIQNQVITQHSWLTMNEFSDLVTIAEMTPGPIALNAATFVGTRIAGLPGALAATFGSIFPALILASLLAYIYRRFRSVNALQGVLASLRPAVVALIASAGLGILEQVALGGAAFSLPALHIRELILFAAALLVLRKTKIGPIPVMAACGVLELVLSLLFP